MTSFWIGCALILIVALPFVVLPLWRNSHTSNEVQRDAANLEILRDQSSELDADFRDGLLTQDAFDQGKRELQSRLLEEVKTTVPSIPSSFRSARTLALVLGLLLPLCSLLLYIVVGNPKGLLPQSEASMASEFGIVRSEVQLKELEKKLEQDPKNPNGWVALARSYAEMKRYSDSVRAFDQLVKLVPNEAQVWAEYADVYAMKNQEENAKQPLQGEPTKFINKALELDGNNQQALALSGTSAMERGDYATTIAHWTKLADQLPKDHPELAMIQEGIKQASQFNEMKKSGKMMKTHPMPEAAKPATNPASAITGTISISPALLVNASPTDTVFIFARPTEGPKMPIVALRKQVKDLPYKFTLDDSMAFQPQVTLAKFDKVLVAARVSKTGNAAAQSGDLQGISAAIKPGSTNIKLVIDSVVK